MGSKATAEQGNSQEDIKSGLPAGDSRPQRPGSVPGATSGNGAAISFALPKKKPRVVQADQSEDQRYFSIVPLRAALDKTLTPAQFRMLVRYCSYTNRGGLAWVGYARLGQDQGVSGRRAGQLINALEKKGYLRTTHKGYPGQRAYTRQVVYKEDIDADEAATIAGELAPAQLYKQEKETMEAMKPKRGRGRPKKEKTYQDEPSNSLQQSTAEDAIQELVEIGIYTSMDFAGVEPALLEAATRAAAEKAQVSESLLRIEQIEAELRRMLE